MNELIIMILCTLGAIFVLIAALGIYRMPDFYLRLSVTVKAGTLGVGCILGAVAFYFYDFAVSTKVFAIIFFLFITSPVAAFMISRTAFVSGIHMFNTTIVEEDGQGREEVHAEDVKKND